MTVISRLAERPDFEGIFALQEKYHISRISPEAIGGGFVTTFLTEQNLLDASANDGLFIAVEEEKVVGYVLAFSWAYARQWPFFDFMTTTFDELSLDGITVTTENSYQYGPVCIDEAYRGGKVLLQLFEFQRELMRGSYLLGVTFINRVNVRSMEAHTRKLGWTVIGGFEFNGNEYVSLAYRT